MKLIINSILALGFATASTQAFVPNAFFPKKTASKTATITPAAIASKNGISTHMVAATVVEDGPPTDTEEKYGTVVGDTKGAALRLDGVAISRGASPLLKNINWSVQPNERWGLVGVNGAGKSTLLGAITGTVRMDEGHAFVHSNARVGYLKQSVSIFFV
jgi:ABC-type multidrug transport system fused ATPase/permease subunit